MEIRWKVLTVIVYELCAVYARKKTPATCTTPNCIQQTNELQYFIYPGANPCNDFYQFVCGKFIHNAQLNRKDYKDMKMIQRERVNNRIRQIIEEPADNKDRKPLKVAKRLYTSCLNSNLTEDRGLKVLKQSFREIGGWPVLDGIKWDEFDFEWKWALYKLREMGFDFEFLIKLNIIPDPKKPSKRIIELTGPWKPYANITDEDKNVLHDVMVNVSVLFGAERRRAEREFKDVIEFMRSLLERSQYKREENKPIRVTLSELQYVFRDIPWLKYINQLQYPAPNVFPHQIVLVSDVHYFLNLQNALKKFRERTISNYFGWSMIVGEKNALTREMQNLLWRYYKLAGDGDGIPGAIPLRHTFCTEYIQNLFPSTLQAAYVRKYLSKNAKGYVYQILRNIMDEFKNVLKEFTWIDTETRNKAIKRLYSSSTYIGFPNRLLKLDKLDDRYKDFDLNEENFLKSTLQAKFFATSARFKKLQDQIRDEEDFDKDYALNIETIYSSIENALIVPAGYLQGVIYSEDRPQYMNYGALGSALGHHLFHAVFQENGCDDKPKLYDWLSRQTIFGLTEKLSCISQHYGKYAVPEIRRRLNSANTKYEDLADIVGVKLAYDAYNKWSCYNGPEAQLPGVRFTSRQLFWISYALRFCEKRTFESMEISISNSSKSLNKFRVIGALRNIEEFSEDFNCAPGAYMNYYKRCDLW